MSDDTKNQTENRYTARTPDGRTQTGTANEIATWLQEQDWEWGEAGPDGGLPWRRAVAARAAIQTGRVIDGAVVEDAEAFLTAVAVAGLMTFDKVEGKAEGTDADN